MHTYNNCDELLNALEGNNNGKKEDVKKEDKKKEEKKKEKRMDALIVITNIDECSVSGYMTQFQKIEDELKRVKEKKLGKKMYPKVTVRISSVGGSVDAANMVISMMEKLKKLGVEINTECAGFAYSSGMLIFLHGMKRTFIDKKFCYLMWHQCFIGAGGKLANAECYVDFVKTKMWREHEKYLINNTNVTMEILDQRTVKNIEWFIDYKEAKKLGIVTD